MAKLETQYAHVEIQDGVLFVTLKPGAVLDEAAVAEMLTFIEGEIGESKYPVVADIREIKSIKGKARDMVSDFGDAHLAEAAFIVKGEISRLVANIMIHLTHPRSELREFDDPAEAAKWIQQFAVKDVVATK